MYSNLLHKVLPALIVFIGAVVGYLAAATPTQAQSASASVEVSFNNGQASYLVPSNYGAVVLKWAESTQLEYSWDGINYIETIVAADETEAKEDGYLYSLMIQVRPGNLLRLRSSSASSVNILLIPKPPAIPASGTGGTPNGQVNLASGANYSDLSIIPRQGWGADETYANWIPEYMEVGEIIIHHTVFDAGVDYAEAVRYIYYYHAVTLDWGDIGYNYLIDPNGVIYEGRIGGEAAVGAHTYAYNAGSIGIALIGNFMDETPTPEAIASLKQLLAERAILNGLVLTWNSTVTGHRNHPQNSTECPGDALYAALPTIVSEAEQMRQDLQGGAIDLARDEMVTALAGYADVRLQLTFTDSTASPAAKLQLIPKNSGIKRVVSMTDAQAVIEVESWTYYGGWVDDTYDRVRMLYLLFSLDPNFSAVATVSGFAYLGSSPETNKALLIGQSLYLRFSQAVVAGSGNIEIRNAADNTLIDTIGVQSGNAVFEDRRVRLVPNVTLQKGVYYYVTVCGTCVENGSGSPFSGFSDTSTFRFRKAFRLEPQANYDGDDSADISIFDPPTATWYIQRSSEFYYADPYIRRFGWSSALPLPAGDYDGDNKTDIGIVDPVTAYWYIQLSGEPANAAPWVRGFGWKGATFIPSGDYDEDGKTDLAVWDAVTARWYIQMSGQPANAAPYTRAFGWSTATPVSGGDYDADGKTDIAIFDRDTARWYIQMSDQPENAAPYIRAFGWKGVTPIMGGDYDGDGKTDIAIYAQESGTWFIQLSSLPADSQPLMRTLGGPGQIPLLRGDYDYDGATDIGVYDPATADWKLLYSSEDFAGKTFVRKYGWSRVIPL